MRAIFAILAAFLASSVIAAPPPGLMACAGCGAVKGNLKTIFAERSVGQACTGIAKDLWCTTYAHNVSENGKYLAAAEISICRRKKEPREFVTIEIFTKKDDAETAAKVEKFLRSALKKEKNGLPKNIEEVTAAQAGTRVECPQGGRFGLSPVPEIEDLSIQKTIAPAAPVR